MANKDRRTKDRMMGGRQNDKRTECIMTKETGARMCLLKRQNDIMDRGYNDKIRDSMYLMKRQSNKVNKLIR